MSNLVDHARRELELCGQLNEDPAYAASVLAAIGAIASYDGHSGYSAMAAREQLHTLLGFGNLSPLTDDPDEWMLIGVQGAGHVWQSRRNGQAFSEDGGATYYVLDEYDRAKMEAADAAAAAVERPMHRSRHQSDEAAEPQNACAMAPDSPVAAS